MHTDAMERLKKNKKKKKNEAVGIWGEVVYRISRNKAAIFGLCVLLVLILFAFFPQVFARYGYDDQDYTRTSCAPTIETIVFARDLGIIREKLSPQLSHLFAIACFYITG